ncbi:hypothetical protein [Dyadobacter sp. 32]|uniref:hypothetical protein n=1 Tax=Dyadobacter sp. 32 TaxID=538966 RepID=UPI0011EF01F1
MAIFGAGSSWEGREMKDDFFNDGNYAIGWDYQSAKDLYDAVSLLKAGDIVYLKSNQSGSRTIRVKGIGVVTQTLIHCLIENGQNKETITDESRFYVKIKWIVKDEFRINIPDTDGKLTNVRAATFYEEYLTYVQTEIIGKLFQIKP